VKPRKLMFSREKDDAILAISEETGIEMQLFETAEIHFEKNEDTILITRCVSGDQEAFAQIVKNHQRMVFNVAYRFLGSYEEAEELTQEVFLRVYKFLRRFEGKSSLRTWIYKITVNSALNRQQWLKRRKHYHQVSLDSHDSDPDMALGNKIPGTGGNPESSALNLELQKKIQGCLDKLPKRLRIAIILRDVEGLSYDEISEALGINQGTVKSRIARARSAVKDALSEYIEE
jgi:RNA polymerase sigma-70 factor (ECF subfamily)